MESLREPAMSFNELGELFRMEHKSKMLTEVGGDLYQNIAELLRYLKKRYEQQLSADPENPKTDRANQERILGTQRAKAIVDMRMEKICKMALETGCRRLYDQALQDERYRVYASCLRTG